MILRIAFFLLGKNNASQSGIEKYVIILGEVFIYRLMIIKKNKS
jgi:hypothetical protein